MANKQFVNTKNNVVPNDGAAMHSIWVCDTEADIPTSGLSAGDLVMVIAPPMHSLAVSATQCARISSQLFSSSVAAGVTASTTQTSIIGSGVGSLALPANFFTAGKTLRFKASGTLDTGATGHGITLRLKKGSTNLWTQTFTVTAITVSSRWELDLEIIGRSTTTTADAGSFAVNLGSNAYRSHFPAYGSVGAVTISASSEAIDFTAEWAVSSADDDIVCETFTMTLN